MNIKKLLKKKGKALSESNHEQLYAHCTELAESYFRCDAFDQALQEYNEALDAATTLNNKHYVAIASRMIGETQCVLGEFEEAVKHQKVYLNLSREDGDLVEEQRALATLGRTFFVKGESISNQDERETSLELSQKYYQKSLQICERLASTSQISQRKLSEMKSPLYMNLGLTLDAKGCTMNGIDYITKAVNMYEELELSEELCRCFMIRGSLEFKFSNTADALRDYKAALKIAERVENKAQLSSEILSLQSDVLLELSDFVGAKQALVKAYRLNKKGVNKNEEIEKKLKIVVAMCQAESKLMASPVDDHQTRKRLNETLGDGCVAFKRYHKAIEYYHKMLECSIALGLKGKDLVPAYVSLSQTYKDNKQFALSMEFFQKELEVVNDNPAEACKTLLSMIEILELQKEKIEKLTDAYNKALTYAKKSGDYKLEATVLKNQINTMNSLNQHEMVEQLQKELNVVLYCLNGKDSDTDSLPDSDVIDTEVGADVDLSDLTDLNTDSESDDEKHTKRRTGKTFSIRRNEKGETPLHVACIKGNINLIQSLLKQGHPVNIQDAAGWSPLHEACNHGNVAAVEILLESGANIDDRGGTQCEGVTPLHDAAANGHLEIVDTLLRKGASPLVRTDSGQTVLECLVQWRERVVEEKGAELDSLSLSHYNDIVQKLKDTLNRAGYDTEKMTFSSQNVPQKPTIEFFEPNKIVEKIRKGVDLELSDEDSPLNAANDYKNTIQSMRRKNKVTQEHGSSSLLKSQMRTHSKSEKPAFLTTEDVGDDWLENDLVENSSRPGKRQHDQFDGQQIRNAKKLNKNPSPEKEKTFTVKNNWNDAFDDINIDDVMSTIDLPSVSMNESTTTEIIGWPSSFYHDQSVVNSPKPKYQKVLSSVGFKRNNYSTLQETCPETVEVNRTQLHQVPKRSPQLCHNIKVRVEEKLFLIPVPQELDDLKIKWLSSEASRRYYNLEGITPVLNLTTDDGALLDENDPLSIVIGNGELHATVLSWNIIPLLDRYIEICNSSKIVTDTYLKIQLDRCQANSTLEIKDSYLSIEDLTPALKAISHFQHLQHICLSAIYLQDRGFKVAVDCFSRLLQLRSLDVNTNCITSEGISYLSSAVSRNNCLQSLEEINISFNPIVEDDSHHLINLLQQLPFIRSLKLKYIGLNSQSVYSSPNFVLDAVEELDISANLLEREGAMKFLSSLNSGRIKRLNLSSTGSQVFRECLLFLERGNIECLQHLELADMSIDDSDIEQLATSLRFADQLTSLNLSCNPDITEKSHNALSGLQTVKELILSGCNLLTEQHGLINPFCRLTLSSTFVPNGYKEGPYNLITNL